MSAAEEAAVAMRAALIACHGALVGLRDCCAEPTQWEPERTRQLDAMRNLTALIDTAATALSVDAGRALSAEIDELRDERDAAMDVRARIEQESARALSRMRAQKATLRAALEGLLDYAERTEAGHPPGAEEWFAVRDAARSALVTQEGQR